MIEIGTSGFRGVDGTQINEEFVKIIAQTASNIIKNNNFKKEVVVGFDKRAHSRLYAHDICRVLIANKIKTILCPYAEPSPLLSFAGKIRKNDITMMVTASHNPYIYNGIKIFGKNGVDISSNIEEQFNRLSKEIKSSQVKIVSWQQCINNPLFSLKNFEDEYVTSILSQIKFLPSSISAIFETMDGASNRVAAILAKRLKNNNILVKNVKFTTKKKLNAPIPSKENLSHLESEVKAHNCKFAFATDGDGDRLAVISPSGKYYNATEVSMLIYEFAVTHKGEKCGFVGNQSFSSIGRMVCERLGRPYFESEIGYKHISQLMIDSGANYGAENSSMCYKGHTLFKDGLLAFAMLLEVVSYIDNTSKSLDQIIEDFKQQYCYNFVYSENSFRLPKEVKMQEILQKISNFSPIFDKKTYKKQILSTNVKFVFENNSWLLLRPSGTENCVRVVCENSSQEENDMLTDSIIEQFENFANVKFEKY